MKIYKDINVSDFEEDSWDCGYFWERIHEQNLEQALDWYFEEIYPEGLDYVQLNDILRFDGDQILKDIGYKFR